MNKALRNKNDSGRNIKDPLEKKIVFIVFLFFSFTFILLLRAAYLASGKKKLQNENIYRQFLIPGMRGKVFNLQGNCIAWSERKLGLFWDVADNLEEAWLEYNNLLNSELLAKQLPEFEEIDALLKQKILLFQNVPEKIIPELHYLLEKYPLSLEAYFIRKNNLKAKEQNILGKVVIDQETGLEIGISGLEKKYDHILRAKVQRYSSIKDGKTFIRHYDSIFSDTGNGKDLQLKRELEKE